MLQKSDGRDLASKGAGLFEVPILRRKEDLLLAFIPERQDCVVLPGGSAP